MKYRDVEQALAATYKVPGQNLGAFRARLRHLRNLGVPDAPRPGKGKAVDYTTDHALQMLLALELEACGLSPEPVAKIVRWAWENTDVPHWLKNLDVRGNSVEQSFLVFEPDFIAETTADYQSDTIKYTAFDVVTLDKLTAHMREIGGDRRRVAVINLTAARDYLMDRLP